MGISSLVHARLISKPIMETLEQCVNYVQS